MKIPPDVLGPLILGMRSAYARGENAMDYARKQVGASCNALEATLIAYDLQSGSYTRRVEKDPVAYAQWCDQLAPFIAEGFQSDMSLLEVGVGDGTTLSGILGRLPCEPVQSFGIDISWSRCAVARDFLRKNGHRKSQLAVGDLFHLPFADHSIDVVYTSHSLEPNGGREREALVELLRVTRHRLVLCEPIFELASSEAQQRMQQHGYVRGLADTLAALGHAPSQSPRLLPFSPNPLNPSGIVIVDKLSVNQSLKPQLPQVDWYCPLTHIPLCSDPESLICAAAGLAYPVLRGLPLLRPEHVIVASRLTLSQ